MRRSGPLAVASTVSAIVLPDMLLDVECPVRGSQESVIWKSEAPDLGSCTRQYLRFVQQGSVFLFLRTRNGAGKTP
jgi:hypothetical protein